MNKNYFLILLFVVAACGQHESRSEGYTNVKAVKTGEELDTLEKQLADAIRTDKVELFDQFISDPDNINLILTTGKTPLMLSVINGKTLFVFKLLNKNADTLLKDNLGKTALDYAGAFERIKLFLSLDPNSVQLDLIERLQKAILDGATGEMQIQLENGADPNGLDSHGEIALTGMIKVPICKGQDTTPCHKMSKKTIILKQLLAWKDKDFNLTPININLSNSQNEKPLSVAKALAVNPEDQKHKDKLIKMLQDGGATE